MSYNTARIIIAIILTLIITIMFSFLHNSGDDYIKAMLGVILYNTIFNGIKKEDIK